MLRAAVRPADGAGPCAVLLLQKQQPHRMHPGRPWWIREVFACLSSSAASMAEEPPGRAWWAVCGGEHREMLRQRWCNLARHHADCPLVVMGERIGEKKAKLVG